MILTVISDVHGNFGVYKRICERVSGPTFQLGDMGVGFGYNLPQMPEKNLFTRGNHDNPAECKAHPNYAGDYGYIDEMFLFFVGGGFSIDWPIRKQWMASGHPVCWWEDEELSPFELSSAVRLYGLKRPRFVISHECPVDIGHELVTGKYVPSRTSRALQEMFDIHQPEVWIFGHHHIDKTIYLNGTKFICLRELGTYELEIPML